MTNDLDVKLVLAALDLRDKSFYSTLSDEQKKKIALQDVILRWLSAVGNPDWKEYKKQGRKKGDKKGAPPTTDTSETEGYLLNANVINEIFGAHSLYGHPELEWLLLSLVGSGEIQPHLWIPSSPKTNTPKIDKMLRSKYPLASREEIVLLKKIAIIEDIVQLARDFGMTDEEVTSIKTESKKRNG